MKRSTMNLVAGLGFAVIMAVFAVFVYQTSACGSAFFGIGAVGLAIAAVASAASLSNPPVPKQRADTTIHTHRETEDVIEDTYDHGFLRVTMSMPVHKPVERVDTDKIKLFEPPEKLEGWSRLAKIPRSACVDETGHGKDFVVKGVEYHGRRDTIVQFANGSARRLVAEYEPENKADRNAVRIDGVWAAPDGQERRAPLGYLDRRTGGVLCEEFERPELCAYPDLVLLHDEPTKPHVKVRVFIKPRRH